MPYKSQILPTAEPTPGPAPVKIIMRDFVRLPEPEVVIPSYATQDVWEGHRKPRARKPCPAK